MTALFVRLAALLIGMTAAPQALADIYAFTDETGMVHFTNAPDDPRYARLLAELPPTPAGAPQAGNTGSNSSDAHRKAYSPLVDQVAHAHQLDKALLHAVIAVESGYNPKAISRKGAAGLMQLMPQTARRYGVNDLYDPMQNLHAGARYLKDLLAMFDNDLPLSLAAYNAGENAVIKHGKRIPPYRETSAYVPRVIERYKQYRTKM